MTSRNRQWIFKSRPVGDIADADLVLEVSDLPAPGPGEIVVRTQYLSLDPANRLWMNPDPVYMPPIPLDTPMLGLVAGVVTHSASPRFQAGDLVMGLGTWSDYVRGKASQFSRVPALDGVSPRDAFAIFCAAAPTAYFGVKDVCAAKPGETLVVSGAGGAVGSLAGQLGKAEGCRVIGIAGGADKCARIVEQYGMDAAIDYKSEDVGKRLAALCPSGIHCFFDNVAGAILEAVLPRMALFGRIAQCGAIAGYNHGGASPKNFEQIVYRRLKVQGFIVFDYADRYDEANAEIARLYRERKLTWRIQEASGLENALSVLRNLYTGANDGKQLLAVDPG